MTNDRKVRKSEFQHLTKSSVLKTTENRKLEIVKDIISKEVPELKNASRRSP